MSDIPGLSLDVAALPEPPEGMEIARVDVIVRLRKKGSGPSSACRHLLP